MGMAEMPVRAVPEATGEWPVISPEQVATGAMAAMAAMRARPEMAALEPLEMPLHLMAAQGAMAEIPARRELVRLEVWRVALALQLERMEPMA